MAHRSMKAELNIVFVEDTPADALAVEETLRATRGDA